MSVDIRTIYHSGKHNTLLLAEDGQRVVYRMNHPPDVKRLFSQLGFPESQVRSGLRSEEGPLGPIILFSRTYVQKMPGEKKPSQLIWCCLVSPDRAASKPEVLTPAEAKRKYNIGPSSV